MAMKYPGSPGKTILKLPATFYLPVLSGSGSIVYELISIGVSLLIVIELSSFLFCGKSSMLK